MCCCFYILINQKYLQYKYTLVIEEIYHPFMQQLPSLELRVFK